MERSRGRFKPGAVVLMYHRVAALQDDQMMLAVLPPHFAEHMRIVRELGSVVSLADLTAAMAGGRIPRRAVVVTFDDGYADNLYEALPILERESIPCTFFVASATLSGDREFWWDDADRMIGPLRSLDEEVTIRTSGRRAIVCSRPRAGTHEGADAQWPGAARSLPALHASLRGLEPASRQEVLARLHALSGVPVAPRTTHRPLDSAELARLAQSEFVEIGGHTVNHSPLTTLEPEALQRELVDGKAALEAVLGYRIERFSYPFGGYGDLDRHTVRAVRDAGFVAACANFPGAVWARTTRFRLPRYTVRDCSAQMFERRLSELLAGRRPDMPFNE